MALPVRQVYGGSPYSDAYQPKKTDIIELWQATLAKLGGANAGALIQTSKTALDALVPAANTMAWVIGDADPDLDGVYQYSAGTWTKRGPLPYGVIHLNNTGAGTGDAIEATTAFGIPEAAYGVVYSLNITEANTGPVTISINGGAPRPVVSNTGAPLDPGALQPEMGLLALDDGTNLRLFVYGDVQAILNAAEAARDEAQAAAASVTYKVVASVAALKAVDTATTSLAFLNQEGRRGFYAWNPAVTIAEHQTGISIPSYAERLYIAPNAAADGAWQLVAPSILDGGDFRLYGHRMDLSMFSDESTIEPGFYLRKYSTAGFSGMGLAKIQWRGTDSAGTPDIDGGRIDSVLTNADPAEFTTTMGISPHVGGNDENVVAMGWSRGVVVDGGDSIHSIINLSGGTGYNIGDSISIVSAASGIKATADVAGVSGGAITALIIRNEGYGYTDGEAVTFAPVTGAGSGGGGDVVVARDVFFQGFGTLSLGRTLYIGTDPVIGISDDGSYIEGYLDRFQVDDGVNALFDFGRGIANIAGAVYLRNKNTLSALAGGEVGRGRIIGKRCFTYSSDQTLGASFDVIFVNAASGNVTLTLPAANLFGTNYTPDILIRRTDSSANTVTVQRGGTDTLNGATSETIAGGAARRYNTNGVAAWYSN